ncbi:hypothetical protein [Pedobacter jeongneungensis]|uniref:hypothetical protein n=1 Tax=Pedobacter jeongneungensis TaxID=947309 RepID=UPI0004693578|nr:hypothetical protein [Pedobacter jeongneungensis]
MKKQSRIIIALLTFVLLLVIVFGYKLHWFNAGITSQQTEDSMANSPVQIATKEASETISPKTEEPKEINDTEFPENGNTIDDFVTSPYIVAMDAKGFLNNDDMEDVVLVLQNKTDSTDLRPVLVLLKQATGGYNLYATSWQAIGAAYINGDYQQYDSEDITIDKNKTLIISTYGSGPVGNRETRYCFKNGELVFTYMETYNAGAGQQTIAKYDVLAKKITVEDINTMKEDMPTKVSHGKLPPHKQYLFKEVDPVSIFSE